MYETPGDFPRAVSESDGVMHYVIKQEAWSLLGKFTIKDETQDIACFGKTRSFSIGKTISDSQGRKPAKVPRIVYRLTKTKEFEIQRSGEMFAKVVEDTTGIKPQFTLDILGSDDCSIRGSFIDHEYTFERDGETVAQVSKEPDRHFYAVDIMPGEDDVTILSACAAIDLSYHGINSPQSGMVIALMVLIELIIWELVRFS